MAFFFNLNFPLGFRFRTRGMPSSRSLSIVLACEALQCVPILGIFGIVDMVSNVVGFAFGFCAADPAVEHGLHVT